MSDSSSTTTPEPNGCGGSQGGDSDSSLTGEGSSSRKICRDFMRNVCHRPACRFAHPDNIKINSAPIFCHDFQGGRCFRSTCKFIHCSKEEEEEYKKTGELPQQKSRGANNGVATNGGGGKGGRGLPTIARSDRYSTDDVSKDVPVCKDFLKGVCTRLKGCRYRHPHLINGGGGDCPPNNNNNTSNSPTYGAPVMVRGRGGVRLMAPILAPSSRRRGHPGNNNREFYEDGVTEAKRFHLDDSYPYSETNGITEDFIDYDPITPIPPPPPPPPSRLLNPQHYYQQPPQHYTMAVLNPGQRTVPSHHHLHGHHFLHHGEPSAALFGGSQAETIKALEDENFMLKRRIEELKSTNEFLLTQNATFRVNSSLSVGTSVAQVQPLAVSAVTVSAAPPAMSQPSIIGITSSSLTGSQPLPTISISTLPTVTPVSISQQPQIATQSQTQIFLPAQQN